jgi:glycine/D-amino acid oxidase-like deaminating enzyme
MPGKGTDSRARRALADAKPAVFWSDRPGAQSEAPTLTGEITADLTVIGGGFTGLWTSIQGLEDEPGLRVVVLEAERCGFGASSRNGGFCDASLTHGLENGLSHWPDEIETLVRLGRENLDGLEATLVRHGIDADFRRAADVGVATEPWHLEGLEESRQEHERFGYRAVVLDREQMQARVHSPTYLGGFMRDGTALVDPARLCWGLRAAAESRGATVFEHTPAVAVRGDGRDLRVITDGGAVRSPRVITATNAYPGPVRAGRRYVIPVYDHVLVTAPLSAEQLASLGWADNDGLSDLSNQFHYARRTADDRILWGGYDATYHYGSGLGPRHDQSDQTHTMLAEQFFTTFPQLEGLPFTHRWGGPIATTTRFTAAWGQSHQGRLTWVAGYTGLGVGASRFGARVALDLAFGQETERTELTMVHRRPVAFPPEPLRWTGVQLTRKAIQRSDRRGGRRGLWLRLLDRFGVGFDT